MQIAINCRSFLNRRYTGIGRYAYHLIKNLGDIDDQNEYLLYAKKGLLNLSKKTPHFPAKNFFLKIDRFNLGIDKSIGKYDVYHSPSPDSIDIDSNAKVVVTVHDLIFKAFPQGHTQSAIDRTEEQFLNITRRATRIICCSKNTKKDLKKFFNIEDEKISLVYQGVDKNIFYLIGEEEEKIADRIIHSKGVYDPFVLTVGTIEPRKNLENVLYAFDKLRTRGKFNGKLVICGMKGWLSDHIEGLIRKLALRKHAIFLGYVTDQELRYFYNKAEAFIFPSFYEGFGFPIVEAFCCGTPVVTSNVSSCPEVAKDAALTVDPGNPEEIAQAIVSIIQNPELRRTLREKGFKRAGDFNIRKTAKKTLDVYTQAYQA